jgi:hypothetical protein
VHPSQWPKSSWVPEKVGHEGLCIAKTAIWHTAHFTRGPFTRLEGPHIHLVLSRHTCTWQSSCLCSDPPCHHSTASFASVNTSPGSLLLQRKVQLVRLGYKDPARTPWTIKIVFSNSHSFNRGRCCAGIIFSHVMAFNI